MSDPQTWTLIGGFFTLMVAMMGMGLRVLRAEVGGVRAEIGGLRAEMNARFDGVDSRIDHLDRDVSAIVTRLMEP